jgi:hypothetical protein
MNYTQLRISLGLTEEQAARLVNAAAFERGVAALSASIEKGLTFGSLTEALARRDPLILPNINDALLDDGNPVEEGLSDARA